MTFHVSHRYGGDDGPPFDDFDALLDEVDEDPTDQGHVGVSVVHESGWCIGIYPGWIVTYENVEMWDVVEPRHLVVGHDRDRVLLLMRAAAAGDLATLDAQPWQAGYTPASR